MGMTAMHDICVMMMFGMTRGRMANLVTHPQDPLTRSLHPPAHAVPSIYYLKHGVKRGSHSSNSNAILYPHIELMTVNGHVNTPCYLEHIFFMHRHAK